MYAIVAASEIKIEKAFAAPALDIVKINEEIRDNIQDKPKIIQTHHGTVE